MQVQFLGKNPSQVVLITFCYITSESTYLVVSNVMISGFQVVPAQYIY